MVVVVVVVMWSLKVDFPLLPVHVLFTYLSLHNFVVRDHLIKFAIGTIFITYKIENEKISNKSKSEIRPNYF